MAESSIPGAIDYLVSTLRDMPAFASPVLVSDGWPDKGPTGVVIGITPDDDSTDDVNIHAELGAQAQWEEYGIPCLIWSYIGGGQEAMKRARDDAFVLFNALDSHLRTTVGRTLGGALKSGTAIVSNLIVRQTGGTDQAGEGRACELYFTVRCKSRSAA